MVRLLSPIFSGSQAPALGAVVHVEQPAAQLTNHLLTTASLTVPSELFAKDGSKERIPLCGQLRRPGALHSHNEAFTHKAGPNSIFMDEEVTMKTTLAVLVLLSMGTLPDSLFAKDKTIPDDLQPPVVSIKPSAEQLPETVLAVKPVMPRGPKDLIEGYEGEMEAVSGRFASELASISHAAEQNQVSSQQADQISKERYQVAIMQFQLLVALRANLEREIDRAQELAQRESHPRREDVSAVVELPFSSLQLNPTLIRYLQLTSSQATAIQEVMSRERQNIDPMMAELRTTGQELFLANQQGYSNRKEVRALAASQAAILSRLIIANSLMQAKIFGLLDGEQRRKLDHLRQANEVAVLDEQ
jgi:hypothetical protein